MTDAYLEPENFKIQFRSGEDAARILARSPSQGGTSSTVRTHVRHYYELMELGREKLQFTTDEWLFLLDTMKDLVLTMPRRTLVSHFQTLLHSFLLENESEAFDHIQFKSKTRALGSLEIAAAIDFIETYWAWSTTELATPSLVQEVNDALEAAGRNQVSAAKP